MDPWGFPISQSRLLGEFEASERPCGEKGRKKEKDKKKMNGA